MSGLPDWDPCARSQVALVVDNEPPPGEDELGPPDWTDPHAHIPPHGLQPHDSSESGDGSSSGSGEWESVQSQADEDGGEEAQGGEAGGGEAGGEEGSDGDGSSHDVHMADGEGLGG